MATSQIVQKNTNIDNGWDYNYDELSYAYNQLFDWLSGIHTHDLALMQKVSQARMQLVAFDIVLTEIMDTAKEAGLIKSGTPEA